MGRRSGRKLDEGERGRDAGSAEMEGVGGDFDKNNEEWYNTSIVELRVF